MEMTDGGLDYSFECIGNVATMVREGGTGEGREGGTGEGREGGTGEGMEGEGRG